MLYSKISEKDDFCLKHLLLREKQHYTVPLVCFSILPSQICICKIIHYVKSLISVYVVTSPGCHLAFFPIFLYRPRSAKPSRSLRGLVLT